MVWEEEVEDVERMKRVENRRFGKMEVIDCYIRVIFWESGLVV